MTENIRKITRVFETKPTLEGAGVKLKRVFGNPDYDPFLLLDHFGSNNPEDYVKGFPWHPHRGIETVTYMIEGEVQHSDSIGNSDVIKSGEVQWMTAGSGIMHEEMPKATKNLVGFQLWVNLPKKHKMTVPRYMGITDLKTVEKGDAKIKIISGKIGNKSGTSHDLFVDVEYFDIHLNGTFTHKTNMKTVIIYLYKGLVEINGKEIYINQGALLNQTGDIKIIGNGKFLFIAGDPLNEPVAWGGPIVMNTQEELQKAFKELDDGTFIKNK